MEIYLSKKLPECPSFKTGIRHAPAQEFTLTMAQTALKNALRYIPLELHNTLYFQ